MTPPALWLWPVLAAAFIGSFLGVAAVRYGDGRPIVLGRSQCDSCFHRLGPAELIPILSWLALRGRCRHCAAPIGLSPLVLELAAAGIAIWSALTFDGGLLWVSCLFGWTLLALAALDLTYYVLPDGLTLPLTLGGLAAAALFDRTALEDHVLGAVAGFGFILTVRYAYRLWRGRDGIGLGDAKLFAAAGAWLSWTALPSVLFLATFSALAAVALAHLRDRAVSRAGTMVPFGAFLSFGMWIVWLYGPLAAG